MVEAEACFIWLGMNVQIIEGYLIDNIPYGGREITSLLEVLSQ